MTSSTPTPKIEAQDQATSDGSGQGAWWREWLKPVVVVAVVSLLVGGITLVTNVWMGSFESLRADIRDGNARLVEEIRATDTRLSEEIRANALVKSKKRSGPPIPALVKRSTNALVKSKKRSRPAMPSFVKRSTNALVKSKKRSRPVMPSFVKRSGPPIPASVKRSRPVRTGSTSALRKSRNRSGPPIPGSVKRSGPARPGSGMS